MNHIETHLKNLISQIIPFRIKHIREQYNVRGFLNRLKELESNIDIIYDIGAHTGQWSILAKTVFPLSRIICFEANPSHSLALENSKLEHYVTVLSSGNFERDFYQIGGTGDSLFLELGDVYRDVLPTRVTTQSLDNLCKSRKLPKPDLVKIDVQGAELEIIEGATEALSSCKFIIIECPIVENNEGAPDMKKIVDLLKSFNFVPIDLVETHIINGILVQIDICFAKSNTISKINRTI